jgi:N-methylhydantoinase A
MNSDKNSAPTLSVAIDTGGTFTDVTLVDRTSGSLWKAKVSSTPADHSLGFIEGIRKALAAAGVSAGRISHVFHGTTVATNAILEGRGAEAALLTTAGFRHVLEIGRHDVPRTANMYHWVKTKRPVPPHRIFEVRERLDHTGAVLTPLSESDVRSAAARIRDAGVRSVAVCFLHAYANADHERRAAAILRVELPDAFVSLSSEVLPTFREFERTMATVLNAYVMPAISSYAARLEQRLADEGIDAPLLLMKSSGGVTGVETVRAQPIQTALSGPAGGVVGAGLIAQLAGHLDVITLDIGGTSADICLMAGAKAAMTTDGRIGDWPLQLPILDINTIGAGGGSIARIGPGGLTVGPQSAGASPGPVSYGGGGQEPTVTDAHAVLGHLTPYLLGGELRLDVEAGRAAIEQRIARPLGIGVEQAARGIVDIANSNMMGAIRVVSVERGYDPARFSLVAFGGAGPLHGSFIGRLLGMKAVVVPPAPGVLSSFGLLVSDLKSDFSRTCLQRPPGYDLQRIAAVYAELEAAAAAWLRREDVPPEGWTLRWMAALRYEHQGFELTVDWPGRSVSAQTLEGAISAFHREHERLYTFAQPDAPVELVQLRVQAIGSLAKPSVPKIAVNGSAARAQVGVQKVWTDAGWTTSPIYERGELPAGAQLTGPAIVQQLDATTYILPGQQGSVDAYGNIVILERS